METIVEIGTFVNDHIIPPTYSQDVINAGLFMAVVAVISLIMALIIKSTQKH